MGENARIPVSGCIVTYNSGEEILTCLESLIAQTKGVDLTLYVSDNGSSDGTPARVREKFPSVTVLDGGKNVGFGSGHNRVLPLLTSRYHAIINPDIVLREDAVSELAAYMEAHPEVGLVMPDIRSEDGSRQLLPKLHPRWRYLIGGRLLSSVRRKYCRADEPFDKPTEIEFCSGCFMLIRTELFQKLGGFDERYFLYMEDADLSREAAKTYRVEFVPQARVVHAWHRASGKSLKALKLHFTSAGQYMKKWRKERKK